MTSRPFVIFFLSVALAGPGVLARVGTARADGLRLHVGGSVRVHGSVGVRIGPRPRARPPWRTIIGGYYGFYFAPPPPAYPYEDACCYDARRYHPAPVAVALPQPPAPTLAPLPRLALGLAAGSVASERELEGDDVGLFVRLRVADALQIELEGSEVDYGPADRVDSRLGAALYLDFAPRGTWSPYLVGGVGVVRTEAVGGALDVERGYGEAGAGLRWNLSARLALEADLRAGAMGPTHGDDERVLARTAAAGAPAGLRIYEDERYGRFRLGVALYF